MRRRARKVAWREPLGFHRRQTVETLRSQGMLSPWFWVRPPLLGLVLLAGTWAVAQWRYGSLPLPRPIWTLAALMFLVPAMLWLIIAIDWLLPGRFALSPWGLRAHLPHPARFIEELRVESSPEGRVLVVRSTRPKRPTRELRTLLPMHIEPEALQAVLPECLQLVRDDLLRDGESASEPHTD